MSVLNAAENLMHLTTENILLSSIHTDGCLLIAVVTVNEEVGLKFRGSWDELNIQIWEFHSPAYRSENFIYSPPRPTTDLRISSMLPFVHSYFTSLLFLFRC